MTQTDDIAVQLLQTVSMDNLRNRRSYFLYCLSVLLVVSFCLFQVARIVRGLHYYGHSRPSNTPKKLLFGGGEALVASTSDVDADNCGT